MSESRRPVSSNGGYLSIREVLDSLIDEFDDITISKIRFLESRGLIHPERTPSGYRKFYPADVERLRWILRQQRENFLPLKVIKRRLDVEDGRVPELPENQSLFEEQTERQDRDLALANVISNIRQAKRGAEPEPATGPGLEEPEHGLAGRTSPVTNGRTNGSIDTERSVTPPSTGRQVGPQAQPEIEPEISTVRQGVPAGQHSDGSSHDGQRGRASELVGVTLSTEELAAAASTTVEAISELQEFGFISSETVGGVSCFDGNALIITKAIVGLRAFGLEPRHLKLVRNAAERDAFLYAQAVAPLLRQRNPDARARARSQLDELANKGAALYEQILRLEIQRLGGA